MGRNAALDVFCFFRRISLLWIVEMLLFLGHFLKFERFGHEAGSRKESLPRAKEASCQHLHPPVGNCRRLSCFPA